MDHGWVEHDPKPPGGVHPFVWYHLLSDGSSKIFARQRATGNQTTNSFEDRNCFASGQVGLRSYSSGGVWRNVSVVGVPKNPFSAPQVNSAQAPSVERSSASESVLTSLRPGRAEGQIPLERSYNCGGANRRNAGQSKFVQHISSLRYMSGIASPVTTVRGVVVLMTPVLYVQDSTGGVAIPDPQSPPLRLGDEVEVTGRIEPNGFSSTLRDATVCPMWAGAPTPPLLSLRIKPQQGRSMQCLSNWKDACATRQRAHRTPGFSLFRMVEQRPGDRQRRSTATPGFEQEQPAPPARDLRRRSRLYAQPHAFCVSAASPWSGSNRGCGEHARYLIGAGGFLILMLALLAYLLYLRVKHWRLHAILDERERLAHEMHDTIAQSFAGIGFQLQAIRNEIPSDARLLHQQLDLASELAHPAMKKRDDIAMLRPESLDRGAASDSRVRTRAKWSRAAE